jgi:hypothetical protein
MKRNGFEKIGSFEKALEIEESRLHSMRFQKKCPQYYYNFLYYHSGLFGDQIERYFSLFSRDQFHILTLEQLKEHPTASLRRIFEFLGLDAGFQSTIDHHNKSLATTRLPMIKYVLKSKMNAPRWLVAIGKKTIGKIDTRKIPPIKPKTRTNLLTRYEEDLRKLANLTGLRLD